MLKIEYTCTLQDVTELLQSFKVLTSCLNLEYASGYQSYNGSFDFSGVLNKIIVEVGGRDINLAIGPMFDDVTVNVFYNVINTIITQHITSIEEIYYLNIFDPVELDFVEEVFEFNDVSMNEGEIFLLQSKLLLRK